MIKIGVKVKVIDSDQSYARYQRMAEAMRLENWKSGEVPINSETYIVIQERVHENKHTMLYGIQDKNYKSYIVNERAITSLELDAELDLNDAIAKTIDMLRNT